MPKLREVMWRWGGPKYDLLSRNFMSDMRPCSKTDRQIGSKFREQVLRKFVFPTN